MRIIGLLLTIILLLAVPATVQAQSVPWPSISPSYRCDEGLAVFSLANVGSDMGNGAPYTVSTPRRVIESGVFWLAAGGHTEFWYNAPGIELTFAYVRPDSGATVRLSQTCGDAPVTGTQFHHIYAPMAMRYCELAPAVRP